MSPQDVIKKSATLALRIINGLGADGESFSRKWIRFNAFYNTFSGGTERKRLMSAIACSVNLEQANEILKDCDGEIKYLYLLPPGNMRFDSNHPKFREQTTKDIELVRDDKVETLTRLRSVPPLKVLH